MTASPSPQMPLPPSLHPQSIRSKYLALRRQLPCSARSLTLALLVLFITFNLLVYTSYPWLLLLAKPPVLDPELPIDRRESSSWMQAVQHPFAQTPDWTVEWFRRSYLDPSLNETEGQDLIMDVVYTWVNGSDPRLLAIKDEYQDRSPFFQAYRAADEARWSRFRNAGYRIPPPVASVADLTANRFRDMNELKYSVRSVSKYFSHTLFNRIHILTTAVDERNEEVQIPSWLDLESSGDRVRMVPHGAIFDNSSNLPSFNSLAIESQMHHISGVTDVVSVCFVFLLFSSLFFSSNGIYPLNWESCGVRTRRFFSLFLFYIFALPKTLDASYRELSLLTTVGKFIVWRSVLRIAKPTHMQQCKTTALDLNKGERLVSEHKRKKRTPHTNR